jgi:hypothetical protein
VFETHLNSCAACADEFAGFNMARTSIIEWRNEEFLSLQTPLIEIPYEKPRELYNAETDSKVSRDWLAELRRVFRFHRRLQLRHLLPLLSFASALYFLQVNLQTMSMLRYQQ